MHTKLVDENIFLIDLETCGYKNLIASYVLKGEKTLIVESGPASSVPNLLSGLEELNVRPEEIDYVAVSHVHIDHSGGAGALLKKLPNAKVIVHPKGISHLVDPSRLWAASKQALGDVAEMFGKPEPVPENRIISALENGGTNLGNGLTLRVIETPGHASHNVAFYEQSSGGVFPGDSAGVYLPEFDAVFPTTPPPFRPDFALVSLDKLIRLKPNFLYYSHFGKVPNAVKRLRNYDAQIRTWLNIVQEGVKRGEKNEDIRENIFEIDETIRNTLPELMKNPIHRKILVENSVDGFIDFSKNPQI